MKNIYIILLLVISSVTFSYAQPPGYYSNALGKNGMQLQTALKSIIDNHSSLSYPLWTWFSSTDNKGNNKVWDMYSDKPGATPSYTYTLGSDQCGNYNSEGDCYNHEHVWPKSYFNDAAPMYSDLHHIVPTDGWVNNKRSTFPLGLIGNASWTSSNGTKVGTSSSYAGYNGKVFEPIDEYKGDFARMMFYTSTRYKGEDGSWNNWEMANGAVLTADASALLLQWHQADSVSQKEIDRNNAIYNIQNNRNPFIDYPIFAECIWGTSDCKPLNVKAVLLKSIKIFPNPSDNVLKVVLPSNLVKSELHFEIYNAFGQHLMLTDETTIDIKKLAKGVYALRVIAGDNSGSFTFIKK